jgi:hypothetical protein
MMASLISEIACIMMDAQIKGVNEITRYTIKDMASDHVQKM